MQWDDLVVCKWSWTHAVYIYEPKRSREWDLNKCQPNVRYLARQDMLYRANPRINGLSDLSITRCKILIGFPEEVTMGCSIATLSCSYRDADKCLWKLRFDMKQTRQLKFDPVVFAHWCWRYDFRILWVCVQYTERCGHSSIGSPWLTVNRGAEIELSFAFFSTILTQWAVLNKLMQNREFFCSTPEGLRKPAVFFIHGIDHSEIIIYNCTKPLPRFFFSWSWETCSVFLDLLFRCNWSTPRTDAMQCIFA